MSTDDQREVVYREDEPALLVALFRYGVIAPLVERDQSGAVCGRGAVVKLMGEITGRPHHRPGRGPLTLTARTVYSWLHAYRRGGIDALRPRYRKDRGQARVIDAAVLARAVALRHESCRLAHRSARWFSRKSARKAGGNPG
ncbi:MAG TPA: helix-turn-helix domain-containing protein, partial [Polyangia bacterium]